MKGGKKKLLGAESSQPSEIVASIAGDGGGAGSSEQPTGISTGAQAAAEPQQQDEMVGADADGGAAEDDDGELPEEEAEDDEQYEDLQIEEEAEGEAVEGEENGRPKLAEGFYEIETVRKKRVRKVRIMEEPLPFPCDDPSVNHVNNNVSAGGAKGVVQVVHENGVKADSSACRRTSERNDLDLKLSELRGMPMTNGANVNKSQEARIPGEGLSNGFVKADGTQSVQSGRCTGAKRRKSGSVKRFKQDSSTNVLNDMPDATIRAISDNAIAVAPEGIQNHPFVGNDWGYKNKSANFEDAYNISQIVKPVGYQAAVSNGAQEVSITFLAKRSDGKEVTVDNKFLKANNPLLLINFYEQHLRYNPSV
nr:chromo domain protein LHP1-like [Ipomoea batatas]